MNFDSHFLCCCFSAVNAVVLLIPPMMPLALLPSSHSNRLALFLSERKGLVSFLATLLLTAVTM